MKPKLQYAAWTMNDKGEVDWIAAAKNKKESKDFASGILKTGKYCFYGTITLKPAIK